MTYQETIDYLFGLQKHGIKFGLANSLLLMERLGKPHLRFPAVHVAGTNGKGSTSAFLARMLRDAGFRTGLYTSPHLVSFTERIRINGTLISEERVVELARRARERSADLPAPDGSGPVTPTFFEVTTALAFSYFAEEGADIVVVETGMGGRLDSTNVITPLVSVITNIDLEHTEYLGGTLAEIAAEKAGIIKPGVPVVTGVTQAEALQALERTAASLKAPLFLMGRDFEARNSRDRTFDYRGPERAFPGLRVSMLGRHQVGNACLAVAAAECLAVRGFRVPEPAVRSGLEAAVWEGRLERVAERPDLYLDGAHNPASAAVLAEALRELKPRYRRLVLIVGILADKDFRGILSRLIPLADDVIVTRPEYARALAVEALAAELRALHPSVAAAPSLAEAIAAARRVAGADDLILVTGSLYTVGDARAVLVGDAGGPGALKGLKG